MIDADEILVLSPRPARIVARFEPAFEGRDAGLRTRPEFARLAGEVHAALRRGVESAA